MVSPALLMDLHKFSHYLFFPIRHSLPHPKNIHFAPWVRVVLGPGWTVMSKGHSPAPTLHRRDRTSQVNTPNPAKCSERARFHEEGEQEGPALNRLRPPRGGSSEPRRLRKDLRGACRVTRPQRQHFSVSLYPKDQSR